MTVETQPVPLSAVPQGATFTKVNDTEHVFILINPAGLTIPADQRYVVHLANGEGGLYPQDYPVIPRAFKAVPAA